MRTHAQVITDAEGPAALARLIGVPPGNVKQWRLNDSIPAPYWQAVAEQRLATLDELAAAAAAKKREAA